MAIQWKRSGTPRGPAQDRGGSVRCPICRAGAIDWRSYFPSRNCFINVLRGDTARYVMSLTPSKLDSDTRNHGCWPSGACSAGMASTISADTRGSPGYPSRSSSRNGFGSSPYQISSSLGSMAISVSRRRTMSGAKCSACYGQLHS